MNVGRLWAYILCTTRHTLPLSVYRIRLSVSPAVYLYRYTTPVPSLPWKYRDVPDFRLRFGRPGIRPYKTNSGTITDRISRCGKFQHSYSARRLFTAKECTQSDQTEL